MKIKETNEIDRPRERLVSVGACNLSNEELLSIILKTGTKDCNVKELSLKVLKHFNSISELKNASVNKLTKIKGIGKVKAIELIASIELGKRVFFNNNKEEVIFNNTKVVYEYFKNILIGEKQENFYAIYLDTKNKVISYKLLFKGTIDKSIVHPREIFKHAIYESATFIMVVHNHPSGDTTPSNEDINFTNNLYEIGNLLQIPLIDHVIVSDNSYYSFYEYLHKSKSNE